MHARSYALPAIIAAALLSASCAEAPHEHAEAGVMRTVHQPSSRPYSAAVQAGETYWLAGKIGSTQETAAMEEGRVAAETHNIMRSFEALLADLGMDFGNVVRGMVYLTDIADYSAMNEAYGSYFEEGDAPSRVTVAVSELVGGATIEISFVAVNTDRSEMHEGEPEHDGDEDGGMHDDEESHDGDGDGETHEDDGDGDRR